MLDFASEEGGLQDGADGYFLLAGVGSRHGGRRGGGERAGEVEESLEGGRGGESRWAGEEEG